MQLSDYLEYVKYNLGLTSTVRDKYIEMIITSAIAELKNKGVDPEGQDESYIRLYEMVVVDLSAWKYRTRGGEGILPPYLRLAINNLIVGRK